ncbi:MAG: methionine-rich copper-binding protein CopC [Pseudohongiellaceae bacterium]
MQHVLFLTFHLSIVGLLSSAVPSTVLAQVPVLSDYQVSPDSTGFVEKTETSPKDDDVLLLAPTAINLDFPRLARLVKFTLRDETRDWVDIQFRYDPVLDTHYVLALPTLSEASYYTADWAVLSANDRLVQGSFSFSFGEDAQRPSLTRAADELLLQQRYGDPTIRYVRPPATQIIIGKEPPRFDPPFTIELSTDPGEP